MNSRLDRHGFARITLLAYLLTAVAVTLSVIAPRPLRCCRPSPAAAPLAPSVESVPRPLSDDEQILQLVLNHPQLESYYRDRERRRGRKPLVLTGDGLPDDLNVTHRGSSVQVLSRQEVRRRRLRAYADATIDRNGNGGHVSLAWDRVTSFTGATVTKQRGAWRVTTFYITCR